MTGSSESNERAAKSELQVATLSNQTVRLSITLEEAKSNNLTLRKEVVALESKLAPRMITATQLTNFIFLTEHSPKIPIRVISPEFVGEVPSFAWQIRNMLTAAHFPMPDADTNRPTPIFFVEHAISFAIGAPEIRGDLAFVFLDGTDLNRLKRFYYRSTEATNGLKRFTVDTNSFDDVCGMLMNYFLQIGITVGIEHAPTNWIGPNNFAILVKPKF